MIFHDRIARRAYELFEMRRNQHGQEWADWFQAERDIRDHSRARYFSLAVQYYVAGRFAVHAGLNPPHNCSHMPGACCTRQAEARS